MEFLFGLKKYNLLLIIVLLVSFTGPVFGDGDNKIIGNWEFWSTTSFTTDLNDKLNSRLSLSLRYNKCKNYYKKTDISFLGKFNSNFNYGYGFGGLSTNSNNSKRLEFRPYFYVTPQWKWRNFNFSNRVMLEYRFFNKERSYFRYRNKFTVSYPIKVRFLKNKFIPYIAEEIYIFPSENKKIKIGSNRVFTGVKYNINKSVSLDFHYIRQTNGNLSDLEGVKEEFNATGLTLMINF